MFPVLVTIGSLSVFSFSIFLVLAWMVWSYLFWKTLRREGTDEDPMFDLMFYSTIVAFLAARLGFVVSHWSLFEDTYLKIAAIWVQPGLSLYTGLLGGFMMLVLLGIQKKVRLGIVMDALGFSLPAALLVGKIGSLLDGSEVGKILEKIPWAIQYVGYVGPRHPVQVYEILWLFMLLILLMVLARRANKNKWPYGVFGLCLFLFYPPVMFALEFLKESSVYWSLTANQWILIAMWAEALGMYYVHGGGRDRVLPFMRQRSEAFRSFIGGMYATITRRRHHDTPK